MTARHRNMSGIPEAGKVSGIAFTGGYCHDR
jgi:hypothetical protein